MACGNTEAALENLTIATELRLGWAEALAQRGFVLAKLDRLDEARQALSAALAADPGHEPARASLAALDSTRPADC
jgi:Flp pilus assembly protein TadD